MLGVMRLFFNNVLFLHAHDAYIARALQSRSIVASPIGLIITIHFASGISVTEIRGNAWRSFSERGSSEQLKREHQSYLMRANSQKRLIKDVKHRPGTRDLGPVHRRVDVGVTCVRKNSKFSMPLHRATMRIIIRRLNVREFFNRIK